jgi:predicted ArsR family transcriptional regulator
MGLSLIERVKIQAQVLVPLVRTLQAELGEERANALVRKSIGALYRQFGDAWWRAQRETKVEDRLAKAFEAFAAGDAIDYEVVKQTPDAFELNVTGCRYAKFYQELGAPELGVLLTCEVDFPFTEGFGGDVRLTRTQTVMQGASHCDFRYKLDREKQEQGRSADVTSSGAARDL